VTAAAGEAVPALRPKDRALLAVLLLFHGRPCPRDLLARAVWGAEVPGDPGAALRLYAARARPALEGGGGTLEGARGGYVARPAPGTLDAAVFSAAAGEARAALEGGDLARASAALGAALAAWPAPDDAVPVPAADADAAAAPEVAAEAARLTETRRWARLAAADVQLDLGGCEAALPALRAAVIADPGSERGREQLAVALAQCGRRDEALAALTGAREAALAAGAVPGPWLRPALDAVLAGEAGSLRLAARYRAPARPGGQEAAGAVS
jgi:DNA-binding SARP family transcriptional activator